MGTEKFCLRWNDFESNISVAFRELREDKDFFDVTLSCDEEQQLQAHKVILSACSPFFRNILRRNPHQHPLLYLKGVKYTDLQSVLNFMYHGEVNVAQEELNSFLAVAEDLRVKGLTQSNQSSSSSNSTSAVSKHSAAASSPRSPPPSAQKHARPPADSAPPPKRPRPSAPAPSLSTSSFTQQQPTGNSEEDDDIQEVVPVKSEPRDLVTSGSTAAASAVGGGVAAGTDAYANALATEDDGAYDESYEDYGQYDQSYDGTLADPNMSTDGNKGQQEEMPMRDPNDLYKYVVKTEENFSMCGICFKFKHVTATCVRNHLESIHFPGYFQYTCSACSQVFSTKTKLNNHKQKFHRACQLR